MSKKDRYRADTAEKHRQKREREQKEAKMAKVRRLTAIITAAILAAALLAAIIGGAVYSVRMNNGEYLRSKIAASSKNIDVDGSVMSYYYNDVVNTFVDRYGSYVGYYGFEPTVSAKFQEISDGVTWFEYFMEGAQNTVTALLALNEAAAVEGIVLTDAERTAIEARVERIDTGLYGRGVNHEDILKAKLIEALAYKYQFAKQAELEPSDSEISAKYKSDPARYQSVDYLAYAIDWSSGSFTEDEAKAAAERLSDQKSPEAFKSVMRELIAKQYPALDDEELDDEVALYGSNGALYSEGNEFSEWAFDGAKLGETLVITDADNSQLLVYMLTREPARDENKTVDVRHILFKSETYGSAEKALKAAEKVFDGLTAEDFSIAALEWSDDAGSYYNGGLYESVVEGTMVEDFDKWCFDSARKAGELAIIETELGAHIMYFVGEGSSVWESSAAGDIVSERFDELNASLLEAHTVEFDLTVLDDIEG